MTTAPITYAGIGSRTTPDPILALMRAIAAGLVHRGWVLRSGGAPGADQAFAAGARAAHGDVEEFLPWPGFADRRRARLTRPTAAAYELAAAHHPAWARLGRPGRALHARNAHIVLGAELGEPARFVVCWTPDGSLDGHGHRSGGTGQALRIAHTRGVGVINLARPAHLAFACTFMTLP